MDDGSGYCGCGSEIKTMSDAARIANKVMAGAGEGTTVLSQR